MNYSLIQIEKLWLAYNMSYMQIFHGKLRVEAMQTLVHMYLTKSEIKS